MWSGCGLHPADVVFALDASGSIWGPDFDSQLDFVNNLVGSFTVGPQGVRVGVATFGNQPKQEFNLNTFNNVGDIQTAISHITQARGSTNTASALHSIRREFFEEQGRTGVVKVAIVITDGQSNEAQATKRQAQLLRDAGVHVFAIGVGRNVAEEELEAIASQPSSSHVFMVDSFQALESISIVLAARTCEGGFDSEG
ncbi:hypothetical protein CAPTEDRAFT_109203 [Capitella teleta]|uniref:VWFA domain-containing protein n=1 Tax=Capitella teleta TaxID=283909 RepID=R7TSZ0_CAPTE|nr:hypothetical protein CAPTEDRAFT_109203 [Capitella teleta]|eukprot:ELT96727.1 hypothetical protein CAPTEDRAFT_109203 [Capitella teleta]